MFPEQDEEVGFPVPDGQRRQEVGDQTNSVEVGETDHAATWSQS